jgi:phosphatidylinositol phospholipase C beta
MAQAGGFSGEIHRRWVKQGPNEHLLKGIRLWLFVENDFSKPPSKYTLYVDNDMFYLYGKSDDTSKECFFWDITYISDVRRTKFPSKADQDDDSLDDRVLQLVYRRDGIVGLDRVHFLAASEDDATLFMDSVNQLTGNLVAMNASPLKLLRKVHFQCVLSANGKGEIPLKVMRSLLRVKSNVKDSECPILGTLDPRGLVKSTEDGRGKTILSKDFSFEMFMSIYSKLVNQREDVQKIVEKYSKKRGLYLSSDEFWNFVTDQRQLTQLKNELLHPALKKDEALSLVEKFEPSRPRSGTNIRMTPAGMISFLLSEENSVVESKPLCQCVEDMSQPLNHYYINSSHNTYLTGGQLRSASTVEMYIQVLLLGCRCIELDCWVYRKEIVITHGGTLCTKILFKDVLEAIRDYAFVASDYPVILSIENHVKEEELLNSMASMYTVILGEFLLNEPLPGYPCEPDGKLPPLEKLKRKIIIKDKIRGPKVASDQRPTLPSISEAGGNGYGTLERVLRDTPNTATLERDFKMDSPSRVDRSPTLDSVCSTDDPYLLEPDLDQDTLGDDVSINELVGCCCYCCCVYLFLCLYFIMIGSFVCLPSCLDAIYVL